MTEYINESRGPAVSFLLCQEAGEDSQRCIFASDLTNSCVKEDPCQTFRSDPLPLDLDSEANSPMEDVNHTAQSSQCVEDEPGGGGSTRAVVGRGSR